MSDFDERYRALRHRFVERCRGELPMLEGGRSGETDAETLRAAVHRLSGAAGTFGYPELSRLAGAVDDELIVSGEASPDGMDALIVAVRVLTQA